MYGVRAPRLPSLLPAKKKEMLAAITLSRFFRVNAVSWLIVEFSGTCLADWIDCNSIASGLAVVLEAVLAIVIMKVVKTKQQRTRLR
jgi:hypothetical protein